MATCADLVAAVLAINDTLIDIRDNYLQYQDAEGNYHKLASVLHDIERTQYQEVTLEDGAPPVKITVAESSRACQLHLGARLLHRDAQLDIASNLSKQLQLIGDTLNERAGQALQFATGTAEIPDSELEAPDPIDPANDKDTEGVS